MIKKREDYLTRLYDKYVRPRKTVTIILQIILIVSGLFVIGSVVLLNNEDLLRLISIGAVFTLLFLTLIITNKEK